MSAPRVALVGASGYVGRELDQLLAGHPGIELAARMTARPGVVPEVDPEGLQPPIDPLEPGRGGLIRTPPILILGLPFLGEASGASRAGARQASSSPRPRRPARGRAA